MAWELKEEYKQIAYRFGENSFQELPQEYQDFLLDFYPENFFEEI